MILGFKTRSIWKQKSSNLYLGACHKLKKEKYNIYMIQIFYGYGKGKTSALNGQAVRLVGAGLRVGIFRFLKGRDSAEDAVLQSLGIRVTQFHSSSKFVFEMNEDEKKDAKQAMNEGLEFIKHHMSSFDAIMLDEILDLTASSVNFISQHALSDFISSLPKDKEIFISGHTIVKPLFDDADLITRFEKEKHYFDKGVKARRGIEF